MIRTWFRTETAVARTLIRATLTPAALLILLATIYWPTLRELEERWRIDSSWSHGYAVVPAFLLLLRSIVKQSGVPWRNDVSLGEVIVGTFAITVGLGLHGVSNLYFMRPLSLDAVSLVVSLLGLLWVVGGHLSARAFGGAVLFLLFMVPLPLTWQQPLAERLQHLVSITSETLLSLCGVPVNREGYLLRLPGQTVEVAEGCSGLRQITLFLAMSVFVGLMNRPRGVWLPLLVLSIPVAVFANTVRITLTGLIVACVGSGWASGVLHDVEGLFSFALGLGLLWLAAGQIRQRFGNAELRSLPGSTLARSASAGMERDESDAVPSLALRACLVAPAIGIGMKLIRIPENHDAVVSAETSEVSKTSEVCRTQFSLGMRMRSRIAWLLWLLSCGVAADAAEQRWVAELGNIPTIPLARPLADFPKELGEWVGVETPVARREFLYGEEHLNRIYRHRGTGQTLTLWMVYTDDGRDRGHHPEVCLRTIGHTEARDQRQSLPVPGEGAPVERFFFRRPSGRSGQWIYHWYYVFRDAFDLQTSPSWWQRLQRSLRFHRSGLSVEVFAPKFSTGDQAAADEFVSRVAEHLQQHVPPTALRRTARGNYLIVGNGRIVND